MKDNKISTNPLDYVTLADILELGLTPSDIKQAYQPSSGGVYHARGAENQGKTLWIAHFYRYLVDHKIISPYDTVGNMSFKGKYAIGYTVLKGDDLKDYLWQMTHIPLTGKCVIIDEADSEFPARLFTDKEQTEIATKLWHTSKLGNYVLLSSHLGNSVDVIIHLASHYYIYPLTPDFATNSLDFVVDNRLDLEITDWTAHDIIKTMLIYNRKESTENAETERNKVRPSLAKKAKKQLENNLPDDDIDIMKERVVF